MQIINFWNKLNLFSNKVNCLFIAFLFVGLSFSSGNLYAQKKRKSANAALHSMNLPHYDKKWLHYGFLIGVHTSSHRIKYSESFSKDAFKEVQAIESVFKPGFSLGFIGNFRIAEFLDLRLTPKVSFDEYELRYTYVNQSTSGVPDPFKTEVDRLENTMVELPILLRYNSRRRGNFRMYLIGGITPAIEASGKKDQDVIFETKNIDLKLEFGFGSEIYYPLGKFAPEIRFSYGLINMLGDNEERPIVDGIESMRTKSVSLYFQFQ